MTRRSARAAKAPAVPAASSAVATGTQEHPGCETRPGAAESAVGDGWELRRGDCLAGMAGLADDSVDVVITDPPYDEHVDANFVTMGRHLAGTSKGRPRQERVFRNEIGIGVMSTPDIAECARQFARVAKRWILVFCAFEQTHEWRSSLETAGARYIRTGAWEKPDSTPQLSGDRPAVWGEAFVLAYAHEGAMHWNGGGKRALYRAGVCRGHERSEHPTQKPLSLMLDLITDFTEPGETVLDAFAGSGTTGVAAAQLGRRFIGFELAMCSRCAEPAEWSCSWTDARDRRQKAYLCEGHHASVMANPTLTAFRDNYFSIACRRLRGEEAKPRPEQPGLFDAIGGTR